MRRRRQKNTLLPKMLGLAVLVNAILLPLLAQLGVFKVMRGQRLTPVQLVQAPPPPRPKTRANKTRPHVIHHQAARRAAPRAGVARPSLTHPNLMAGSHKGAGNGGVDAAGTGKPGQVPKLPSKPKLPVKPTPPLIPVVPTPPLPVTPTPAPPAPTPLPVTPPPPHMPALVNASVLHRVDPQIPDDFTDQNLPVTFRALFIVHPDGTATVETQSSTGDKALDRLALDAARRWTFRPATEDGKPIDGGILRLRVEFVPKDEG